MLRRRSLVGCLLGFLVLFSGPGYAGIEEGAIAFLKSLAEQAVKSLAETNTPRSERIKRFRVMFRQNFAVRSIGKFVLGSN